MGPGQQDAPGTGRGGGRAELERRAALLLDAARAAGASEAEVCARSGRSLSAKVEKGDLGQVQSDEGSTCGLRVILDGRLGFASTNQASDQALQTLAVEAVAIARLSPPDPANVLPSPTAVEEAALMGPRVDPALRSVYGRWSKGLRGSPMLHSATMAGSRWTRPPSRRSREALSS